MLKGRSTSSFQRDQMKKSNRILFVVLAVGLSIVAAYVVLDLSNDFRHLRAERDGLAYQLRMENHRVAQLNESVQDLKALVDTYKNRSEEYYDKWQAERTIAYALWQMFDAATNITWKGQDYTQVSILIPRWQFEYLRNLSEEYGLDYRH